jgi:hypothetical protein
MNEETRRVSDEIIGRLRALGVKVTQDESPEDLARLLDAVENFERTVTRGGGDLMVDEPVGAGRPLRPDERAFVLPTRGEGEPITAFIARIATARKQAAHAHRPTQ